MRAIPKHQRPRIVRLVVNRCGCGSDQVASVDCQPPHRFLSNRMTHYARVECASCGAHGRAVSHRTSREIAHRCAVAFWNTFGAARDLDVVPAE